MDFLKTHFKNLRPVASTTGKAFKSGLKSGTSYDPKKTSLGQNKRKIDNILGKDIQSKDQEKNTESTEIFGSDLFTKNHYKTSDNLEINSITAPTSSPPDNLDQKNKSLTNYNTSQKQGLKVYQKQIFLDAKRDSKKGSYESPKDNSNRSNSYTRSNKDSRSNANRHKIPRAYPSKPPPNPSNNSKFKDVNREYQMADLTKFSTSKTSPPSGSLYSKMKASILSSALNKTNNKNSSNLYSNNQTTTAYSSSISNLGYPNPTFNSNNFADKIKRKSIKKISDARVPCPVVLSKKGGKGGKEGDSGSGSGGSDGGRVRTIQKNSENKNNNSDSEKQENILDINKDFGGTEQGILEVRESLDLNLHVGGGGGKIEIIQNLGGKGDKGDKLVVGAPGLRESKYSSQNVVNQIHGMLADAGRKTVKRARAGEYIREEPKKYVRTRVVTAGNSQ